MNSCLSDWLSIRPNAWRISYTTQVASRNADNLGVSTPDTQHERQNETGYKTYKAVNSIYVTGSVSDDSV